MKEKLKQVYEFFKKPPLWFGLLCYGLFLAFSALCILFLCLGGFETLLLILYSGMGITFFYCTYLFIRYDYRTIKMAFRSLKAKLSQKSKLMDNLFNNLFFRTTLATSFSLLLGIGFVTYNAYAGLKYHSVWNGSTSIYYGFLVAIRVLFLICEAVLTKGHNLDDAQKNLTRAKMFRFEGILLILLNVALIAPVTILALSKKQVDLPMWVAIVNASYAFYKIIVCVYSFVKTRKTAPLSIKGIKNLNLTSALITMLSLENTMILTFSKTPKDMQLLMIFSALAVMLFNLFIATRTYTLGKRAVQIESSTLKGENYDKNTNC